MRTTLINTTFWREDSIDDLHLDSKLLYLYMLTNPDKGLANIYHYKPKVIAAYAGLSTEQIDVAIKQLVQLGYVDVYNGFYVLLKGHEMPKKGRFTEKTIEKEKELIPIDVLEHFNLLINENSSGVAPEHKDIDNNKDKDISKAIEKNNDLLNEFKEANEYWEKISGRAMSDNPTSRNKFKQLRKEHSMNDIKVAINGACYFQGKEYRPQVLSFASMHEKWDSLQGHIQSHMNNPKQTGGTY